MMPRAIFEFCVLPRTSSGAIAVNAAAAPASARKRRRERPDVEDESRSDGGTVIVVLLQVVGSPAPGSACREDRW